MSTRIETWKEGEAPQVCYLRMRNDHNGVTIQSVTPTGEHLRDVLTINEKGIYRIGGATSQGFDVEPDGRIAMHPADPIRYKESEVPNE